MTPPLQPVDLYGDGLTGLLTEVGDNWYYQESLGGGAFERAQLVWSKPSLPGLNDASLEIRDLGSDGRKQVVIQTAAIAGYTSSTRDLTYRPFRPFPRTSSFSARGRRRKVIDLNGDGKADIAITHDDRLVWLEGAGRDGYGNWFSVPCLRAPARPAWPSRTRTKASISPT